MKQHLLLVEYLISKISTFTRNEIKYIDHLCATVLKLRATRAQRTKPIEFAMNRDILSQ